MNKWIIIIIIILLLLIIKKIINLNNPLDENNIIEKYKNINKLQKKINIDFFVKNLSSITAYYVGI